MSLLAFFGVGGLSSYIERNLLEVIVLHIIGISVLPENIFPCLYVLEAVDYVGHDGACRGQLAGALAVEHNVAGGVAADHYGVEHVVNRGKLAFPADEHGETMQYIFPFSFMATLPMSFMTEL